MSEWTPTYSDHQRGAIEDAAIEHGARTAAIVRKAAAGELVFDGETVASFEIPYSSASYIVRRARLHREGRLKRDLLEQPSRDVNESLRRRLLVLLDREITDVERQQARRNRKADPERLRKLGRAAREICAIPGPDEQRLPIQPGTVAAGEKNPRDARTRDDLSGSILAAYNGTAR